MKPYFIAAPPRSGTSLIANLLHKHGVWVGDTGVGVADEHNKYGYFENRNIVRIVKSLFWSAELPARSDVSCFITYDNVVDYDIDDFRQRILQIVDRNECWLYKDSKILHVYPLFDQAFPDATWILPQRNTLSIYDSLRKHKIWNRRMLKKNVEKQVWGMIGRLHERQQDVINTVGDRSILVDVDRLIFNDNYAEEFITRCGLKFDQSLYEQTVDTSIWSAT